MAENLATLEKKGGSGSGSETLTAKSINTFGQINDTYKLVATGLFVNAIMSRDSVSVLPKAQFYRKDSGGNYIPITSEFSVSTSTTNNYVVANSNNDFGEIYVKVNSGSNFTPTYFHMGYVEKS